MSEIDPSRFLDSDAPALPQFEALGHAGSEHYLGLETFPNPGCVQVRYVSDEVMAHCPITGQPDFYECSIDIAQSELLIESKSLKLYFRSLFDSGSFCESLAVKIREDVCRACDVDEERVRVTLKQKSRGGISIHAVA